MIVLLKVITFLFVIAGAAFAYHGGREIYAAVKLQSDRRRDAEEPQSRYYVLPARYVAIFTVGLGFIIIPLLVYGVGVRALGSPAGVEATAEMEAFFAEVLEIRVGPVSVLQMFYGFGGFFAFIFLVSIISKIFRR